MAARKKKRATPRRATKAAARASTPRPRSRGRKAAAKKPTRRPARPARGRQPSSSTHRLDDIAETLAIMMPELAARIAALEHVLIEGKVCRYDDLRHARAFVDLRRGDS